MMKKFLMALCCAGCLTGVSAQSLDAQDSKTLFEELTNVKKKTDKFNLLLNMHGSFDMDFNDGFQEGAFKMKQLRIEAKGQLNNWLSYRYRQRLNRPNNGGDKVDNLPTSIDIAGIGVKLSDKFSIFAGKQCAAYGGIEFDLNPIEIYEYSDMVEYMSNFMTGVNFAYTPVQNHEFQLQILNSLNDNTYNTYGESDDIIAAKMPLVYTLNWNGNFNDVFLTRWSASAMNEAKKQWMYYYAFGNQLNIDNFSMFFDVMYSNEDIDRKGIISSILPSTTHNAFDARYLSLVTKLNYRFNTKWNVFVQGMYETASVKKEECAACSDILKGKYRTSYGYFAGLEYYPMVNSNLHFFATYMGRSYNFTDKAKALGQSNYNTDRISVGFIYQLPMF